jgi:hypothetical protein
LERVKGIESIDPKYGHLTQAQPKLPTVKIWLGSAELSRRNRPDRNGKSAPG